VEAEPSDQLIIRVLFDDTLLRQLNIIVCIGEKPFHQKSTWFSGAYRAYPVLVFLPFRLS
jgi:hypothetical protein